MDKTTFIEQCRQQLSAVYTNSKIGRPDDAMKHRTEGFIHAGQVLGVISRKEAGDIIESTHLDVFGESVEQRRGRKASYERLKTDAPDEYYEIPAIERRS